MKKTFLFLYTLLVFSGVYAQENKVKVEPVNGDNISLFSLKEVRLLDSDFKHIMDLNHAYMLYLGEYVRDNWNKISNKAEYCLSVLLKEVEILPGMIGEEKEDE